MSAMQKMPELLPTEGAIVLAMVLVGLLPAKGTELLPSEGSMTKVAEGSMVQMTESSKIPVPGFGFFSPRVNAVTEQLFQVQPPY